MSFEELASTAEGWIEAAGAGHLDDQMFVARAVGRSMEPKIHDGDLLVFCRGPTDPDTGGSYTVKRYSSEKAADEEGGWRHTRITLSPLNPEYEPIVLVPEDEEAFRVVAELVDVLAGR